jgi:hypothetical protein
MRAFSFSSVMTVLEVFSWFLPLGQTNRSNLLPVQK